MNRATLGAAFFAMLFLGQEFRAQGQTTIDAFGTGTNTFTVQFTSIGNAGNPDDTTGYGSVSYDYRIGTFEISQNQVAAAVASGLTDVTAGAWAGDQPAANMSWYEAALFVNWLNTSTGHQAAYNFSGTTMSLWNSAEAWHEGGENLFRNKDAYYFLPSEDEWYKAAYYDGNQSLYYEYPTGSDTAPTSITGGTAPNTAVYNLPGDDEPADVDNAGGLSPYGTMGQGGNVWEMQESAVQPPNDDPAEPRVLQGAAYDNAALPLKSEFDFGFEPYLESSKYGFRVASVPEPATGLLILLASGLICARRRTGRASYPAKEALASEGPSQAPFPIYSRSFRCQTRT